MIKRKKKLEMRKKNICKSDERESNRQNRWKGKRKLIKIEQIKNSLEISNYRKDREK